MLRDFASNGCAIVYELLFDGKPVAVDLCLRDEHSLYVLKTTYDENERKSSPAMLLRRMAYEQLFQEKELQAIEFYGRAMEWHRRMTDDIRTIYHANAYRYTAIAALRKRIRRSVD